MQHACEAILKPKRNHVALGNALTPLLHPRITFLHTVAHLNQTDPPTQTSGDSFDYVSTKQNKVNKDKKDKTDETQSTKTKAEKAQHSMPTKLEHDDDSVTISHHMHSKLSAGL